MEQVKSKFNQLTERLQQFITEQRDEHQDKNAIVTSGETLAALQLWRGLEHKGVELAGDVADDLENLTRSLNGANLQLVADTMRSVPSGKTAGQLAGAQPKRIVTRKEEEAVEE